MQRYHEEQKFKCNFCDFQSNVLIRIYEHKISSHPDNPMEFQPSANPVSEMVMIMLAEQNLDMMEEIGTVKTFLKEALGTFADTIGRAFDEAQVRDETMKTTLNKLSEKICKIVRSGGSTANESNPNSGNTKQSSSEDNPARKSEDPPSSAPSNPQSASAPQANPHHRRRRSRYLMKSKLLYVGDSVAQNANFNKIEKEVNIRIKTAKAYSSEENDHARWPKKNIIKVTKTALENNTNDDEFTHLVLAAPTVDITNLDTTKLKQTESTEHFKQEILQSCQNIFKVAHNALKKHPTLRKVIILEHTPRLDDHHSDPMSPKPALVKYANSIFNQLWIESPYKSQISVGSHNLFWEAGNKNSIFKDKRNSKYDGVHHYGPAGTSVYTRSLLSILSQVFSSSQSRKPSSAKSADHPQARHQRYSVPTKNRFNILGN